MTAHIRKYRNTDLVELKRITAICEGIIERDLKFKWGCEGRVDSVAVDQLPLMSRANCNFLAFGVEAGTQKILDRLSKNQTLEQIEHAVSEAKRQGILEAATRLFTEQGYDGTSVDDIAAEAGVSKQTVYSHFGNKEKLFGAARRTPYNRRRSTSC